MKSLFKPISNIFGKKSDDSLEQEEEIPESQNQVNPILQLDDHELAKRYCDTFSAVETVQTKLDKLLEAKEHIAEERFTSLNEQYGSFLEKHSSRMERLLAEIDRRIDTYINEKKNAAEKFTDIKKRIQQETKLLEVGVISKEEYIEKIQSFKPEEKEYKERYRSSQELINILKDAKNNKYTPPEPAADQDCQDNTSDTEGSDVADDKSSASSVPLNSLEVYSGKDVNIAIDCGTSLSVKIDGIAIPVTANFVGTLRHEYVLISPPSPFPTVKPKLFQGNKLLIECLFDGRLYIFSSPIIETTTKPIRFVALEYPNELTVKVIRAHSRVLCRIPSTVIFKGSGKESIINDISPNGCRLEATYLPTEKNYIARVNDVVKIQCSFPGDVEIYTASGVIKNVKKKQLTLLYGIQFTEVTDATQKAIIKHLATLNHECF